MRVVDHVALRTAGKSRYATAWRSVEQPFPRGSPLLPSPSAGRGAPPPPGGQSKAKKSVQAETLDLTELT